MAQDKTTKITIEYDLPTNHETDLQQAYWRITYCSFFIDSLFNLIKKSVISSEHQPLDNELELDQYRQDLKHACELGSAVSFTVFREIEALNDGISAKQEMLNLGGENNG